MSTDMEEVVVATVDEALVEANIIETDMSGAIVEATGKAELFHPLETDMGFCYTDVLVTVYERLQAQYYHVHGTCMHLQASRN